MTLKTVGAFAGGLVVLAACSSSSAQSPRQPAPTDVIATVGSTTITYADVDAKALSQPVSSFSGTLQQALYDARRAAVDEMIANRLLDQEAAAQKVDRTALIEKEITAKIPPVSEPEIAAWYQANQNRVQGATLDQVRTPIRSYLTQERMQTVREQFLTALKAKTRVQVMLDAPRQMVKAADGAAKGPSNAPIEIIEFSDFQCPFCQRANPTVNQVLSTYGDKIRFVYRHYPLPNHPAARPAAEAAACANEQGKFWPFHDRLFANGAKLSDADLKQAAAELGADTAKFNACVDSHKYKAVVDADVQAGSDAGVNGTPAFYINGRMVSGAQPFEVFKRIIDEELSMKK